MLKLSCAKMLKFVRKHTFACLLASWLLLLLLLACLLVARLATPCNFCPIYRAHFASPAVSKALNDCETAALCTTCPTVAGTCPSYAFYDP